MKQQTAKRGATCTMGRSDGAVCDRPSRTRLAEMSRPPARGASGGRRRVLVVDDHAIVRQGLARLIAEHGRGLELVGWAADGLEAVERAEQLRPDVILMDVNMPRINGIEATRRIKQNHPHMQIIGLSLHSANDTGEAMVNAGATLYLQKDGPAEVLLDAIENCCISAMEAAATANECDAAPAL